MQTIAIIGVGPRGLYALECLVARLSDQLSQGQLTILLFEPEAYPGSGPNYDPDQNPSNLVNLPERNLSVADRKPIVTESFTISGFPSYATWHSVRDNRPIDVFVSRAIIGQYLSARFQSIFQPLCEAGVCRLIHHKVTELTIDEGKVVIKTSVQDEVLVNEALLTIGHQATGDDDQLSAWKEYAERAADVTLITHPYPVDNIIDAIESKGPDNVGIRGFGLSMIDVTRAVALQYGAFQSTKESIWLEYIKETDIVPVLLPVEKDGLAPSPKPINQQLDRTFEPSDQAIETLRSNLGERDNKDKEENADFFVRAMADLSAEVYHRLDQSNDGAGYAPGDVADIVYEWVKDENYRHPLILSQDLSVYQQMQHFALMAYGEKKASLDYVVGQVWRHVLFVLDEIFSFSEYRPSVLKEIIGINERMKRYTYGPPVNCILELLALVDAGVLDLNYIKDPDIRLTGAGWVLKEGAQKSTATLMVDSVLAEPVVTEVTTPLIKELRQTDCLQPLHEELGAKIDRNGRMLTENNKPLPISMVGRLAIGSLFLVDSITNSFGEIQERWADDVAEVLFGQQ